MLWWVVGFHCQLPKGGSDMKYYLFIPLLPCLLATGCAGPLETTLREDLRAEGLALHPHEFADAPAVDGAFAGPHSLQSYLAYAARKSPRLREKFYQWQAALEKAPQARALPEPVLSYSRYIEEVETRVGAQKNRVALMQKIPWPTKLSSKSDLALRQALVAKHVFQLEKLRLFHAVRTAYMEYAYLGRAVTIVSDNLELLKNIEASLRTRYEASGASVPSVIQTQVEIGKLEDRLLSLQKVRGPFVARLNAAMGSDRSTELPWPELPVESGADLSLDALQTALLAENPALKAARAVVEVAGSKRRLAETGYLPDFALGASVIDTERRSGVSLEDNGKDPVMLTLEMSLPVWLQKYGAAVREAEAEQSAAAAALEDKSQSLSADLQMALYRYEDAGRKRSLFIDTLIPKAEQALGAARRSFAAGKASFADLLETERSLLELQLMAERARTDREVALAELELLSGQDLREPPATTDSD